MPAKSVAQQRFMGMVHALQKGDIKPSKVSGKVKDVAKSMKKKDTKDFASTKHKNKPYKVKKEVVRKLREIIRQEVESCGYTMSAENPKRKLKSPGGTGPEDRDLKVEGQRATKGFKKAFKARNDFFIAMSDFRKKLGDMGTNPKIFKLESELYKFEMDFQKSSAKILDFMQRLSKSPITEAYEMSPAQEKNLKYAIKLYRKGSGKSIEAEVRTIAYALKKGKFTKSAKEIVDTFNKFNKAIDNVLGQHESVNEVNRVALKVYIDWFKKDAKKAKVTPLEYTKYQIKYPSFYGLDKKTLKALLKYFQKNESVSEAIDYKRNTPKSLKKSRFKQLDALVPKGRVNQVMSKLKKELRGIKITHEEVDSYTKDGLVISKFKKEDINKIMGIVDHAGGLFEAVVKVNKDPHKGVKNTAKGKKFNPLNLKGEDKIKALVWSGSYPRGKGSYELKRDQGQWKLNVHGLNKRDRGMYVAHFTKNTGVKRANLYYDDVHWMGRYEW